MEWDHGLPDGRERVSWAEDGLAVVVDGRRDVTMRDIGANVSRDL